MKKKKEKQLIALINSGADMYTVYTSHTKEKKGDGKKKSYTYRLPTHSDTHTQAYRTEALNERTNDRTHNSLKNKLFLPEN